MQAQKRLDAENAEKEYQRKMYSVNQNDIPQSNRPVTGGGQSPNYFSAQNYQQKLVTGNYGTLGQPGGLKKGFQNKRLAFYHAKRKEHVSARTRKNDEL